MPEIVPTVTAYSVEDYRQQIENVARFAERIHIDLMDGQFTPKTNINPAEAWWPAGVKADFHLMYKRPDAAVDEILKHKPHMVIIHAESDGRFASFAEICRRHGVKVGVALLQRTQPETIVEAIHRIDHVLIFSGDLGSYGGRANLDLLNKIDFIRQHRHDIEIGWDGGINEQNISQLASAGVSVFDVGGYIQEAPEPEHAYHVLKRIADETGTT